ncbi:MAG: dethiobiotin synthase [Actinomycetota bacterium]|nr:dethiobiotin synthase [Actinomycetota bacterium]
MSKRTWVVSGTDTGIGKTWSSIALCRALVDAGRSVAVRKPVESFDPTEDASDSELLARATGEKRDAVCRPDRRYPRGLAPPIAAGILDRPIPNTSRIVEDLIGTEVDVLVVEGVGGPRSPLSADGDTVQLAHALGADDVIVISDPGLGAIGRVLLCVDAFAPLTCHVLLNRYDRNDEVHRLNRDWLLNSGISVHSDPHDLATSLMMSLDAPLEVR